MPQRPTYKSSTLPAGPAGTPSPASSSLPGSCSAGNISVTCTYNGCPQQIQPALYTYVTANQSSCVPIIGQMACGCYLLDTDTFDAITQGTCQLSCPPAQQTCSAAPAPAPGEPNMTGRRLPWPGAPASWMGLLLRDCC